MLYSRFNAQVQRHPQKVAIACGNQDLTFSELDLMVNNIAARLADAGMGKGAVVATSLPAGIELIATMLATFKIGACLLPLNTRFTDNEIADYLLRSGAGLVVGFADEIARASNLEVSLTGIDIESIGTAQSDVAAEEDALAPALILFSSGSTGQAKQVVRNYQQLIAEYDAFTATALVDAGDVFLCSVPLHHAHGFSNAFMASLLNGAKLVITPGEFNPRSVIRALDKHGVTVYPSATFMLKMLAATRVKQQPDLSQLRLVFTAGAPLADEIRESLQQALSITACQLYGSTEAGAMALNLGDAPANSVGQPLKGYAVSIINEDGMECPPGVEGDIVVQSPSAATEYKHNPEASAETFSEGNYVTGDIGFKNIHGDLFITGRKKQLINVAGLKVDPVEVEQVLMALDTVREVVVLGKPDGDYGEIVKAVVVADDLTEGDVVAHCKANLAEYKWPKMIEFRQEIPRSPLGKILRKYL